jgi:hypothetical protein
VAIFGRDGPGGPWITGSQAALLDLGRARQVGGTRRFLITPPYCWLVYDHDLEEVTNLGWDDFIVRQWESIFVGYRSWTGLRTICRRWSDLIEIGLGCSQDIADRLVKAEIINRTDRGLEGAADARAVLSGMVGVLADVWADLADMRELEPHVSARLLDQHARLLSFVQAQAFGQDDGKTVGP